MKQYIRNVSIVMEFLKTNEFSSSVISQHRNCYQELKNYLLDSNKEYTYENALIWITANIDDWNYRKRTGFKHCIEQLEDVYQTGAISPEHLSPRCSAYGLLNEHYRSTLDRFISDVAIDDDRYRISCARFLLYLQNNKLGNISELNYDLLLKFHAEDYHKSSKSKDIYEDQIRVFLRYLANQDTCDIGLSLALNKQIIHKIIHISPEAISACSAYNDVSYYVTWTDILEYLNGMRKVRYGKTVCKASKHILTLLYIFLSMHNTELNHQLLWFWFEEAKPVLGSGWKQHRRSLCQFMEYLSSGKIVTAVTGNPNHIDSINTLPVWESEQLTAYLNLLKREGWSNSTISMHKSSNMRFCRYIKDTGIDSFSELTPTMLKDFNLKDMHKTPESKAAYNCRIRSFIQYLYEQGCVKEPYLYKALPTVSSGRTELVQILSDDEIAAIWAVDLDYLNPKELRDYAMVCIGLTMGFRASDIVSLKFENIDWNNRNIHLVQKKTGKLIAMPMPVKTGNILFKYLRDGRPKSDEQFIFIRHEAPYDRIQSGVCRGALRRFLSIPENCSCKFHSVRKTFATQMLNGNVKLELISDSLGHSTDGTVHKYLALDEKKIRLCTLSLAETGISFRGGAIDA